MLPTDKLDSLSARFSELEEMLCQPEIAGDSKKFLRYSKERGEIEEIVRAYEQYTETEKQLAEDREALGDPELRELAEAEIPELEAELERLTKDLQVLLLPKDPNDDRNVILEIRAGAGGEEAALFAADLFRAYGRFAERNRWTMEILSTSEASAGGYKEIVALISGDRVYSRLRFEAGVHRVQRVPATESQGRIHTSTVTVAVLPEADEVDDVDIKDEDLQITIALAGGAGGQHVNRTMSAVQIIHKPTNILVKCQDERSQIQNKAKAMKILKSRLLEMEQRKQQEAIADERRGMVGSGDRSEKIRTYNYPQSRITDHRIQLTSHNLDGVMDGDFEEFFTALRTEHQAALLDAQSDT